MPYINSDYYQNKHKGVMPSNSEDLVRNIEKASDAIDILTKFKVKNNFETATIPFIKEQVEKATASLTEYYILNGGYESFVQDDISSAGVGSFNYSVKGGSAVETTNNVPQDVYERLLITGLLYAGID